VSNDEKIVDMQDVTIRFMSAQSTFRHPSFVQAVSHVNLSVFKGETLALVGESGSGKTTLVRSILELVNLTEGSIYFRGQALDTMNAAQRHDMRRRVQFVFQDPYGSLNPRLTVRDIIQEPLIVHRIGDQASRTERVDLVMKQVGLSPQASRRYPHQFSGGQRQRIAIARALASGPELIIADEPLSALDVSIQSQILNLLSDLKTETGMSYLLVSHDLNAVHHLADRIAVMYLGRIVELASKNILFNSPRHPYSAALIDAMPKLGIVKRVPGRALPGEIPSPIHPPSGCAFHPRCVRATAVCSQVIPQMASIDKSNGVACHHPLEAT
jgi:oligopeptide/dipeptide ABC transporter ATP-binding protein